MRTVIVVVFDDLRFLDRAGPVDVLESASELGAAPYRTVVGSVDGPSVRSGSGVEIGVDVSMNQLRRQSSPIDSHVVVGGRARSSHRMIQMSAEVSPRSVVGFGGWRRFVSETFVLGAEGARRPA